VAKHSWKSNKQS